jgi:hypothetical protein
MVKRILTPEEEQYARIRVLKSIYELTKINSEKPYNQQKISNNIEQRPDEKFDIGYLIEEWVSRDLVIRQRNHSESPRGLRWLADLSKSDRIEEILKEYSDSVTNQ